MTHHSSHSRLRTTAVALALVLGSAPLSGQDAKKQGLPKDWSMHHLVFSKPGPNVPAARLQKLLKDPRYILQQELRAAMAAPPSLPAPLAALNDNGPVDIAPASYTGGPLPRGLTKALIPPTGKEPLPTISPDKTHRIHKDWSVSEGSNGTTGVGQFPATFTQTASACGTDLAIYNTGLTGSSSQATVVAYNNIYASCNSGVPTVYYAYNTGTAPITTSVDLSGDGTQLAFITGASGSAASLVVLKVASSGGSVTAPTTPTSAAAASYRACTAPCMTTIGLSGSPSDSYSSPFYDPGTDTLYVGDDGGKLHKFTGVFLGTPAEAGSPWPVQVSSATTGGALGSPVYDYQTSLVFIGDYLLNYASTCEPSATNSAGLCGYLYSVSSSGTVVQSHQLDYQYGIVDSPIVDPSTGQVFAFVGADNTTACSSGPCAGVFQFAETFAATATGTEVQVGAGYEFMLSGAFDNNYYNSGTGNLYVVGGTGPQNNTLYQIAMTVGNMGAQIPNLYVESAINSEILAYNGATGASVSNPFVSSGSGGLNGPYGLTFGPNGNLFVSSEGNGEVLEYNGTTGAFVKTFVSGGLAQPFGLTFGPNGNLFVANPDNSDVLEYNGSTGAFVTTFVSSGSGGLGSPLGLTFGPNGNLFVTSDNNEVLEYNGSTGVLVSTFVSSGSGGLSNPQALTFGPNGNLFVTSQNEVLEYNGSTGAFFTTFVSSGSGGLSYPEGLTFGPNGNLFVTSNNNEVLEYNGSTGAFVTTFVSSGSAGLSGPSLIVFGPGVTTGPAVAANYTNGYYAGGLQVTEFYTGTHDYIFVGALMATTNPLVGLVSGFDVTDGVIGPTTTPTGSIAAQGGPSGVVVDNSLSTAQNIYYSTTLNSTCTTSGTGGCAVQVIQSAP
jgi:streptogramin lyase